MKFKILTLLVLAAAMVIAACAPAPSAPAPAATTAPAATAETQATSAPAATAEGSATEAAAGEPVQGGTLTIAVYGDPGLWDPKFGSDNSALWAQQQIFATLLQTSPDGTEVLPWLAESYELSPDLKTATFKLHEDAEFCDGTPITARDVKFSFDRALEPDSGVSWQFSKGTEVEVVDDHTVRIINGEPSVWFTQAMTLWGTDILSENYYKDMSDADIAAKPLGSGPFCLESWDKGSGYTLTRNPGYWGRPAYVDRVEVKVVQDDTSRMLQLQGGEIDVALNIPTNQVAALQNVPGIRAESNKLWGLAGIALNQRTVPAFKDKKVRQAMSYAIDRQALVDSVLFGQGEVAKSPFYGSDISFWTDDFAHEFDLEKAQQLMAESEFPDGFEVDLTVIAGETLGNETAVILKDMLSKIGITVNVTPVEAGSWFSNWSSYNYEMLYKLGSNAVVDPAMNIPFDFLQIKDGGQGAAFTDFENAEVTRIAKEALIEPDPAKREALYYDLQRIVMDETPQLVLFHPYSHWAERDNVEGFEISQTSMYRLWDVWKTQQ
jgi:peptide/nickel transport system substrate-binding protein